MLCFNELTFIFFVFLFISIIIFFIYLEKQKCKKIINDAIDNLSKNINWSNNEVNNFSNTLNFPKKYTSTIDLNNWVNTVIERDNNVLLNPSYPPISRNTDNLTYYNYLKNFPVSFPTNMVYDTYKPIGYLQGKTNSMVLILMGREKYKNKYDFYVVPADKDLMSIKIPLPDNYIKDIYNIPSEIELWNIYPDKYNVTELKNDFDHIYY